MINRVKENNDAFKQVCYRADPPSVGSLINPLTKLTDLHSLFDMTTANEYPGLFARLVENGGPFEAAIFKSIKSFVWLVLDTVVMGGWPMGIVESDSEGCILMRWKSSEPSNHRIISITFYPSGMVGQHIWIHEHSYSDSTLDVTRAIRMMNMNKDDILDEDTIVTHRVSEEN